MAYFISHDLCNYLSAIYSNVEFMSDPRTTPSDRELLSAEVRAAIHCMKDQLDALLLFARTGSPLHMRCCSLNQLIQHAVRMVRQHPDTHEVDIIINETASVEDRVDTKKLGSAIYNLLLNACQAAKRGALSKIAEVTLWQECNRIFIRFVDSGPGVPGSILETLFQPFVTEGKSSGIGLGLTIAERVAGNTVAMSILRSQGRVERRSCCGSRKLRQASEQRENLRVSEDFRLAMPAIRTSLR